MTTILVKIALSHWKQNTQTKSRINWKWYFKSIFQTLILNIEISCISITKMAFSAHFKMEFFMQKICYKSLDLTMLFETLKLSWHTEYFFRWFCSRLSNGCNLLYLMLLKDATSTPEMMVFVSRNYSSEANKMRQSIIISDLLIQLTAFARVKRDNQISMFKKPTNFLFDC